MFPKTTDLSTAEGRSKDRYRRAFLTTLVSALSKIVTVCTSLISVPLTLHYLGVERYGLWMTMSSLIACLGFSDLGINNGLLNGISKSKGTDNRALGQQYVSSAFFFLTAIAVVMGLIFACAYQWIPWRNLFHVASSKAIAEAGPAVAAFVGCFLAGIPAGIVTRVQSGYQEGFSANLWSFLGGIIGFAALLAVVSLHGSLVYLVLAVSGVPLIAVVSNALMFFGTRRPWLRPAWSQVKGHISKDLLHSGFLFLMLQFAVAVSYSSDNIVIAQVLGAEAVTQYAVPSKLFTVVNLLSYFVLTPLWPAYAEALARKDYCWVKKTFFRSLALVAGTALPLSILLLILAPTIIRIWIGPQFHVSSLLLVGLAAWSVLSAVSNSFAMLLNAATIINFQVIVALISSTGNITLSLYLTKHVGVSGVVYGSIASQVVLVLIPYWFYTRNFLHTFDEPPISHTEPTFVANPF